VKRGPTVLTGGNWPRHFSIRPDGKFVVVALQLSNDLEVYRVGEADGSLEKAGQVQSENSPSFVTFYSV
jgi:6-phosphogluconolactonase